MGGVKKLFPFLRIYDYAFERIFIDNGIDDDLLLLPKTKIIIFLNEKFLKKKTWKGEIIK